MTEKTLTNTLIAEEMLSAHKHTPMMAQWQACKQASKGALLFFRMGDFYEAFYEDAAIIARELELTLTKRQDVPMSGVPHHTCEGYIDRLVSKGYRVAVAEQTEDPKKTKGLVKREIVRVVSPGTLINSTLLSDKVNNFVAAITRVGKVFGLACLDLTTADFRVIEVDTEQELLNEIFRFQPAELVASQKFQEKYSHIIGEVKKSYEVVISNHDDWRFEHQPAYDFLIHHFKVKMLDGFGLQGMLAAINAAGGLLSFLQDILNLSLIHITDIRPYAVAQFMAIDRATQRHLELTESLNDHMRKNTLISVLDHTSTPMGGRLLRQWIMQPLLDLSEITSRQDSVEAFCRHHPLLVQISSLLESVRDIERLNTRISSGYASPRDLAALRNSFLPLPHLKEILKQIAHSQMLIQAENAIEALPEMAALIGNALVDAPPQRISDGNIFREGYSRELDELRAISRDSKAWLGRYQNALKEQTGIKTLKVGFNKMFGYYIEVSKGQAERMPTSFQRRQTLVNAERFISPELKDYESKVMNAEERIAAIEAELFVQLREQVACYAEPIRRTAKGIALVDALLSLALTAFKYNYRRPIVDDSGMLQIVGGRHPVIEAAHTSEKFIANDTLLDKEQNRLLLITGPNMAGKSTYIRQVALLAIMAQIGSFVPATSMRLGIIDKVFSRIGASDDLSRGQSTFMVEMIETANILNNVTERSLVILDEIGRGTSTYDGISIAWSVAEYLLTMEGRTAKTLFATHYWELTKLEEKIPGAVNYNVAVHESDDEIVFLRKIVRGGADKSYGIHVAKLAGLPSQVVSRAKEILVHLEENANQKNAFEPAPIKRHPPRSRPKVVVDNMQMTLFE